MAAPCGVVERERERGTRQRRGEWEREIGREKTDAAWTRGAREVSTVRKRIPKEETTARTLECADQNLIVGLSEARLLTWRSTRLLRTGTYYWNTITNETTMVGEPKPLTMYRQPQAPQQQQVGMGGLIVQSLAVGAGVSIAFALVSA